MRLCVFASGTGSNFEAIADAIDNHTIQATLNLVVCDNPKALVIQKAHNRGIKTFVFNPKDYSNKQAYEQQILSALIAEDINFIALAGYMRLIGKTLLNAYPHQIINIHPSLLPKYKGLDALGQALKHNDETLGVSVHYVDASLDGGAIIKQMCFKRYDGQERWEIENELHRIEHKLYVDVLATISTGGTMKRALLSVSDRTNLVEFAQGLVSNGYEIIATGSTKKYLEDNGLTKLLSVEDVTGFEEMMDGRVKTLHPLIHGGLLGLRDNPHHRASMQKHGIQPIDLVAVNLYPFKETIAKDGVVLEEAVEQIDIGGPSMLRSAAKNFRDVTVIIDPNDYEAVLLEISENGTTTDAYRRHLATKVFASTAYYDSLIAAYLNEHCETPVHSPLTLGYELVESLRYGENPHQGAQFYRSGLPETYSLANCKQLHGKALSYNNIQDGNAALGMVEEFDDYCVCVAVKHMNPCAIALGDTINEAFDKAYEGDPISIFGGIVAFNQTVNAEVAEKLSKIFLEIILAPSFDDAALPILTKKKNIRLLEYKTSGKPARREFKSVNGGLLVQDKDTHYPSETSIECVTQTPLNPEDLASVLFAQKVVKHVKSNAIVVVNGTQTVGIGAGQMNRVGAALIALNQAGDKAKGAVLASDAFFPMRDTVDLAHQYGIKTIIQPGGSIKDQDSIDACNEAHIAMVVTGERHFKH